MYTQPIFSIVCWFRAVYSKFVRRDPMWCNTVVYDGYESDYVKRKDYLSPLKWISASVVLRFMLLSRTSQHINKYFLVFGLS